MDAQFGHIQILSQFYQLPKQIITLRIKTKDINWQWFIILYYYTTCILLKLSPRDATQKTANTNNSSKLLATPPDRCPNVAVPTENQFLLEGKIWVI